MKIKFPRRVQLFATRPDGFLVPLNECVNENAEENINAPEMKFIDHGKPVLVASILRNGRARYFFVQKLSEEIQRLCASWENLAASLHCTPRSVVVSLVRPEEVKLMYDRIVAEISTLSEDIRRLLVPTAEMRLFERLDDGLMRPSGFVLPRVARTLVLVEFQLTRVRENDGVISHKLVVPVFCNSQWWWTPSEELSVDAKLLHDKWYSFFQATLRPYAMPGVRIEARRNENEKRAQLLHLWRVGTLLRVQKAS